MSFTKKTINRIDGKRSSRVVMTESLVLANATTKKSGAFEVPAGSDFVAFLNTGAANTSAVTTDLEGSFDNSTWADIDASFAADLDTAMIIVTHDASASGDFPFYRFEFTSFGDDSAITITNKVTY